MIAAAQAEDAIDEVAVVAPSFQTSDDDPAADEAWWTSGGWKVGDAAQAPAGLSSFTVVDQILRSLANTSRFPHLTSITVAGHSAGGQYAQRYAAAGKAPTELGNVRITYVVANASSYVYLTGVRPNLADATGQTFATPATATCSCCSEYRYGLDDLDGYVESVGAATIQSRYVSRTVAYLLGDADTRRDNDLDTSCSADLQGVHRFDRGKRFSTYIAQYYPSAPHTRLDVPGVGHSSSQMYRSEQGRSVLFP